MRGAPQVGFSATMRRINSRNSLLTHFLPTGVRCRESHLQYNLKPARCQPTTVSGWIRISARFHPGQSLRKITQKNLSEIPTAVEDAFVAELQAVAAVPGFPRADRGVSERIENREQE